MQVQMQGKILVNQCNANANANARNGIFFIPCACIWFVRFTLFFFFLCLRLQLHLHLHLRRTCEPGLRMLEAILLANENNSCQSETELDLNFSLRVRYKCISRTSKFSFQSKNKNLQADCSMKSGRVVAHGNK